MGVVVREQDWSKTPLGPRESWPLSLTITTDLVLASPVAMCILWGPDLTQVYNDAFAHMIPDQHPAAFSQPAREGWLKAWGFQAPIYEAVLQGASYAFKKQKLAIFRDKMPDEAWFDLSFSPLRDRGVIVGILTTALEVTEQVRTEAALRESEARFRTLVNLAPNFVWFATSDGHVQYLNDRWYAFTGQPPNEAPPSGWVTVLHPDDVAHTIAAWAAARAQSRTYEVEARYRRWDRVYRWHIVRAEPVKDAEGRVTSWFGSGTDIHDRKLAEQALAESEKRFRNMADSVPVVVWTTDMTGACTYISRSWRELTGQSEAEALGRGWLHATHPEDREEADRIFAEAHAHQTPFHLDYRLRDADSSWRWAIDAAVPRLSEEGEFLGFVGSVIDITERKLAEQELAKSEARLRLATEAVELGVWDVGLDDGEGIGTARLFEIHGLPMPEGGRASRNTLTRLVHPDDVPVVRAQHLRAMRQGSPTKITCRIQRASDGAERWIEVNGQYPVEPGRHRFLAVVADITERRQAEGRQALLAREVDHRAKNALAVVQAALRLTKAPDLPSYINTIQGRLGALARAQTLLAEDRWTGADLRSLVQGELAAFLTPHDRGSPQAELSGPKVALAAEMAQPMSMAVHELATNAVKHGALSVSSGRLTVCWQTLGRSPRMLRLQWSESAGPSVPFPPARRGFGSRMLEGLVRKQLGGTLSLSWSTTGLVCDIHVPLERRITSDSPHSARD
ncbi:PAS domain S-box protein [Pseudoroseomonas wenyumeiae]|uniref:histidine kinase n=1 Tax=Teichococcus wenyumeiae TaxID=2478470 RepID=A0A3A9JXI3_9PROT|nr:PAS domain S-box protein [Pseudoroseomonas wenyumeiae]RKK03769.1 PAS domain S-box protein [Pseudoroseomonas wenyumeiae]RMI17053.1 PAS domain S-box protein [Pseudoroseomonas wenyumeiae]